MKYEIPLGREDGTKGVLIIEDLPSGKSAVRLRYKIEKDPETDAVLIGNMAVVDLKRVAKSL